MSDQSSTFTARLGGFLGAAITQLWQSSIDIQLAQYDITRDPTQPEFQGPNIYLLWHEYITFPIGLWRNCNAALLMSRHRDADVLARVAYHAGFDVVRGSTSRGGATAIRELQEKAKNMNLAITPDGPRGPRRKMSAGPIFLSSRLQIPLVCMGIGYDRPWRTKTWDRFAIARPFSRGRIIGSPAMQMPPDLDRAGIEHYRLRVERMMNFLSDEAETWAVNGDRRIGQRPPRSLHPAPLPRNVRRRQEEERRQLRLAEEEAISLKIHRAA
ncbi:lysophospholipid acyltransferase family protein [Lignipirellula cremea]|uniref:DUF374 domain-containing protein n=1 Tax=Lignipirellula cremea TaxID=2528010 RepID=A0A518DTQ8_9BACT|nr:lysophospholipid acyltransferase family protein [Lignipirellula cremea]QDU95225.1 hypothetical protein Pla8534_30400 [Lignipirellula cremea]